MCVVGDLVEKKDSRGRVIKATKAEIKAAKKAAAEAKRKAREERKAAEVRPRFEPLLLLCARMHVGARTWQREARGDSR